MESKVVEEEYVVTLGIFDLKKMIKQARKSPELQTRMVIKIPKNIKTIAYDKEKGVKGSVGITEPIKT